MGPKKTTTLRQILEHKHREVEEHRERTPLAELKERIEELGRPRNFFAAVTKRERKDATSVIAEIKRKSPSAGWIRPAYENEPFDPVPIARAYQSAGASAISCLTDERFFAGKLEYIHQIRDAIKLPVLRKDFIVDPYQVWESRAHGADAVLLIAEALQESMLLDLMILCRDLGLTALVEVHDPENLLRVRPHVGFPLRSYFLLGINNRDLDTMQTDLTHTLRLVDLVDQKDVLVSESGISTPEDLRKLRMAGVRTVLVGETLMRAENPGEALEQLLATTRG